MRIISGKNKGRKIIAPSHIPARPTTDLGKESLFNILNNYFHFDRVTVLDLFAGTGNISYEFASRGAVSIVAVDNCQASIDFIKKTATQLNYPNLTALRSDAFDFLLRCKQQFDIIFVDPPYDLEGSEKIAEIIFQRNILKPDGWCVFEHSQHLNFSTHPYFFEHRKYGKLNFSFLVNFSE